MARREPITPPPATQARYSLLIAAGANGATSEADRWGRGVTWTPEGCGGGGVVAANCAGISGREPTDRTGRTIADPFYVWASDECDSGGYAARDWQGRARRQLESTQSFQVARELWTGTLTRAELAATHTDQASPFLADSAQVITTKLAAARAIGVAEAEAMACSKGRRLMIHAPVPVLQSAIDAGAGYIARDTGGVLTTAMGNIVVADAGYPGTGPLGPTFANSPDNTTQWIYATGLVQVRLAAIEMLPGSLEDARGVAEALDRGTNDITVWAQRLALYQLDPCCRIAVATDVPALPTPSTLS